MRQLRSKGLFRLNLVAIFSFQKVSLRCAQSSAYGYSAATGHTTPILNVAAFALTPPTHETFTSLKFLCDAALLHKEVRTETR